MTTYSYNDHDGMLATERHYTPIAHWVEGMVLRDAGL